MPTVRQVGQRLTPACVHHDRAEHSLRLRQGVWIAPIK
jgi:hypothetical protein